MRKFFGCLGIVAMFAGIVWGMFCHAWLALCVAGMITSWIATNWADD